MLGGVAAEWGMCYEDLKEKNTSTYAHMPLNKLMHRN